MAKRERMKRKTRAGFRTYDHGQPIRTIDTRPMAIVFGFIALTMLLATTPTYPAGTQALIIDLPYDMRSDRPIEGTNPPPIFRTEINAEGQVVNNEKITSLKALKERLQDAKPNSPIIRFTPAPNAPYDATLKALREIDELGLTSSWQFCFGDQWRHRHFDKGTGGSLQIMAAIAPSFESQTVMISDIPEPHPYFFEVCFGSKIEVPPPIN